MERGQARFFSFFISFCCNFCATGTSKEGERRGGHNEKGGRRGHQRVREGTRWSSVAGITGGRGWNLTQERWRAPPLPSSFIHLFQWEFEKETAFFIAFLIKYFLLLPMCDTVAYDKGFIVSIWVWPQAVLHLTIEKETAGKKKLVRSPLGAVARSKHWGPVGSQWGWTCLSWVTSDPCAQQKKTETWKWWTRPLKDQTPTPLSKRNKVDKYQKTCSAGISCAQSYYLKISWNCEMKSWHCWSQ